MQTTPEHRIRLRAFSPPLLRSLVAILGAGLVLAGCGGGSGGATPAPAPAPTPTPAPTPPTPAPVGVPAGLRVTATGHDFLEFGWEAVEGATGYEIQLSLTADDFSSVITVTVTTTSHRFGVAAETTAYARVRANAGDRQSEWSETVTGATEAAPLMLTAPTPRVSDTGPDYIEWTWEAVADALAYEVQVAATSEGLAGADPQRIETTTHRVAAEPETERFLRVRAVAGTSESPVVSDWSDAAAGTSDAARNPFLVSLTPPAAAADPTCSGQAFCPDDGTDPKTARATLNRQMRVSSSHPARITPLFLEGAGLAVRAGDDETPFGLVTWNALQNAVAREGVSFRFDRVVLGAPQGAAAGDSVFITCGPFRCSEAAAERPGPPDITLAESGVCDAFETDFRLRKGIADNGHARKRRNAVDVGWEYTLSHPATVTHEFPDIRVGSGFMTVPGAPLTVTSTPRALSMRPAAESSASRVNKFGPEANRDAISSFGADPGPIWNGYHSNGSPRDCLPLTGVGPGDKTYQSVGRDRGADRPALGKPVRPANCFALLTDALYTAADDNRRAEVDWNDYVPSYRLRVTPSSAVSWIGSRVSWGKDDPFAGLKCESVTIEAAEQLEVCDDFQAEAKSYWGSGIERGGRFELQYRFTGATNTDGNLTHLEIRNGAPAPANTREGTGGGSEYRPYGSRHAFLWLVNEKPGVAGRNMGIDGTEKDHDVYDLRGVADGREEYGDPGVRTWRALMTVEIHDDRGVPQHGDFGKIDMADAEGEPGSDGNPDNYDDNETADRCTDGDGGAGCDAAKDFDLSATFTRIQDTDTCTWTAAVSLACTWDADGRGRRGGDTAFDDDTIQWFISCEPN